MNILKYSYLLCAWLATSISGFGAVFPDMISVESGTQPSSGQVVQEFQVGKWEVTWGKWKFIRDWANTRGYDIGSVGLGSGDEHPVHTINWYDALKWLNAASEYDGLTPVYKTSGQIYRSGEIVPEIDSAADGYRLPTDAEWQWAAHGGKKSNGYTYSGSNNLSEVAWYADNSSGAEVDISDGNGRGTWPAGSKKPNELEICDMSGNVSEWCWDIAGSLRKTQGGNWGASSSDCSVTSSSNSDSSFRHRFTGFRPVRNRLPTLDEIQYPVTRDWLEIKVPEALANPDPDAQRVINVVVVNYLSSKDGTYVKQGLHFAISDFDGLPALENVKIHEMNKLMLNFNIKSKYCIEEGARFRAFNVPSEQPYLGIKIVKCFNIYKEYPDIHNYDPSLDPNDANHPQWHPDPYQVSDVIGLKDLVEKSNVKEVWVNHKLGLPESSMSVPAGANYRVDNGWWVDWPSYSKTYTIYSGWVHRSPGEFIHCRGHQYEAQLSMVDEDFFWREFVGAKVSFHPFWPGHPSYTENTPQEQFPIGKCGSCHFAPNSRWHYDYDNAELVNTMIRSWAPGSTDTSPENNQLWNFEIEIPNGILPQVNQVQHWINDSGNTINDPQSRWLITWFQTIPSYKPIIFNKNGSTASQVENWWDIISDWDEAIKSGKKLYRTGLVQTISPFEFIPNKKLGDAAFPILTPISSSSLPVSVGVKSGPATISANNTITLTGSGTVVLAANQNGDAQYIAAEEVTTEFQVVNVKTSQVISSSGGGAGSAAPSGGGGGQVQKSKKGASKSSAKKSSGSASKKSAGSKKSGGKKSKK
jgi:sulfatase modifying factor 1